MTRITKIYWSIGALLFIVTLGIAIWHLQQTGEVTLLFTWFLAFAAALWRIAANT